MGRQTLWGFRCWRSVAEVRWRLLEYDRCGDEPGRPVTICGIGVAQRWSNDTTAIDGSARASMIIAGREPAKQTGSLIILSRTDLDHDVSILITAMEVAGRERGEEPRWNLSMIIMRPPQHGHGCESGLGSSVSARLVSAASGCAVDGSSNRRARAMLPALVPLASSTRRAAVRADVKKASRSGFCGLCLLDADDHALAVDVGYLQRDHLGRRAIRLHKPHSTPPCI